MATLVMWINTNRHARQFHLEKQTSGTGLIKNTTANKETDSPAPFFLMPCFGPVFRKLSQARGIKKIAATSNARQNGRGEARAVPHPPRRLADRGKARAQSPRCLADAPFSVTESPTRCTDENVLTQGRGCGKGDPRSLVLQNAVWSP